VYTPCFRLAFFAAYAFYSSATRNALEINARDYKICGEKTKTYVEEHLGNASLALDSGKDTVVDAV
jgi:hypothetical protein